MRKHGATRPPSPDFRLGYGSYAALGEPFCRITIVKGKTEERRLAVRAVASWQVDDELRTETRLAEHFDVSFVCLDYSLDQA